MLTIKYLNNVTGVSSLYILKHFPKNDFFRHIKKTLWALYWRQLYKEATKSLARCLTYVCF